MSLFGRKKEKKTDTGEPGLWMAISSPDELESILFRSEEKPQVIFKHSTRCSVSFLARRQISGVSDELRDHAELYLVDVIRQRDLSNEIASGWNIRHESPQVIVLKGGEVLWSGSHWDVNGKNILDVLNGA